MARLARCVLRDRVGRGGVGVAMNDVTAAIDAYKAAIVDRNAKRERSSEHDARAHAIHHELFDAELKVEATRFEVFKAIEGDLP